jgi:peptidyl-prolyl cis-trans isomerase C
VKVRNRTGMIMHGARIWAVATALACLVGCGIKQEPGAGSAQVAERPGADALFRYYVRQRTGSGPEQLDDMSRARLKADLTHLQAAAVLGAADADSDIRNAAELDRLERFAKRAAEQAGVFAAPSEADVRVQYQNFITALPQSEYHVAHILVATEALGVTAIERVDRGESFAKVAAAMSADDSKSRGGDLGWIHAGHLPAQFMAAVQTLKIGHYTQQPINTAYGWHVIKLLETRSAQAPTLEAVKPQLIANLQSERYRAFLAHAGEGGAQDR